MEHHFISCIKNIQILRHCGTLDVSQAADVLDYQHGPSDVSPTGVNVVSTAEVKFFFRI